MSIFYLFYSSHGVYRKEEKSTSQNAIHRKLRGRDLIDLQKLTLPESEISVSECDSLQITGFQRKDLQKLTLLQSKSTPLDISIRWKTRDEK